MRDVVRWKRKGKERGYATSLPPARHTVTRDLARIFLEAYRIAAEHKLHSEPSLRTGLWELSGAIGRYGAVVMGLTGSPTLHHSLGISESRLPAYTRGTARNGLTVHVRDGLYSQPSRDPRPVSGVRLRCWTDTNDLCNSFHICFPSTPADVLMSTPTKYSRWFACPDRFFGTSSFRL